MGDWRQKLGAWARAGAKGIGRQRVLLPDEASLAPATARLALQHSQRLLVVAPDVARAERLGANLKSYLELLGDERDVVYVPEVL